MTTGIGADPSSTSRIEDLILELNETYDCDRDDNMQQAAGSAIGPGSSGRATD